MIIPVDNLTKEQKDAFADGFYSACPDEDNDECDVCPFGYPWTYTRVIDVDVLPDSDSSWEEVGRAFFASVKDQMRDAQQP